MRFRKIEKAVRLGGLFILAARKPGRLGRAAADVVSANGRWRFIPLSNYILGHTVINLVEIMLQ
jgi:hypothetical protein